MRAVGSAPAPTVIMTNSALVRTVTTALSFFNRNTKSFGLLDDDKAYEFLGLGAAERGKAQQLRVACERELEQKHD